MQLPVCASHIHTVKSSLPASYTYNCMVETGSAAHLRRPATVHTALLKRQPQCMLRCSSDSCAPHPSAPLINGGPDTSTLRQPPPRTCMQLPVCASHIHMVKSSLPASRMSPLGCHATQSMPSPGPSRVCTQLPSDTCHTLTLLSRLPVASREPVELEAWHSNEHSEKSAPQMQLEQQRLWLCYLQWPAERLCGCKSQTQQTN
jgi:hypothetical protein